MKTSASTLVTAAIALAQAGSALQLNTADKNSIKAAAKTVSKGLYAYHNEAATTGQFNQPQPWFWWLSGSGWTGLMDYTVYTKDQTYKKDLLSALGKNVGPKFDFVPPEQSGWEANDDQAYWVYNALTAMEYGFDTLPGAPSWDVIATNAFNLFVERWNADKETCGGGLKWQYNPKANGYTYKNAVTNGAFFQTAARLARYTGEKKYADWAVRVWDWSTRVGLVSADFHVYDGTSDDKGANCSSLNHDEWSYNIATYLHGAAHMYNLTGDAAWEARVRGFVAAAAATFFTAPADGAGVMFEPKCEPARACTTDQTSFKASLSRWLGKTAVLVPAVRAAVVPLLERSARGAALACSGRGNSTCGVSWAAGGFDGQSDFGVELSALETIQSLLALDVPFGHAKNKEGTTTTTATTTLTTATTTTTTKPSQTTSKTPAAVTTTTATQPVKDTTNTPTPVKCSRKKRRAA